MKALFNFFCKYLWQLSIVVLGVLISLFLSENLAEVNERKILNLQLIAVQTELINNLDIVSEIVDYHQYTYTLQCEYDNNNTAKELLNHIIRHPLQFSYKKDAFDMLINTGYLRLIKDHAQLLDIMECYSLLAIAKENIDRYMQGTIFVNVNTVFFDPSMNTNKNLVNFDGAVHFALSQDFTNCEKQINKVLSTYDFRVK